jgi:hypothetical protein
MYRRIEFINDCQKVEYKTGLMGSTHIEVIDAWIDKLRGPNRTLKQNARFWFTEKGWKEVGSKVMEACKKVGQRYRILKVKEKAVNVVWEDVYEVAAQPIRRNKNVLH